MARRCFHDGYGRAHQAGIRQPRRDAVYGLGLIGALVYYIGHAHGFWGVVLGILKALVWPAFFVYHVLKFLAA